MSRWFRMYDDVLNDPKAQKLSDVAFRGWVNIMCLASKNDGKLDQPLENVAFSLRKSLPKTRELLQILISANLLDQTNYGWKPHNWDARQFKSDVSTERVKRFRKRHETVPETPPDTEQIQIQKHRTEKKDSRAARFDEFWLVCPKKVGKGQAEKAWPKALKLASPETLISSMRTYAGLMDGKDKTFTLHPATWLNTQRWHDEGIADAPPPLTPEQIAENMDKADRLMKRGKYAPSYQ